MHENRTREFLQSYSEKNIEAIQLMFSNDVIIRDWNTEINGKDAALLQFAHNFQSARSIEITIKSIFTSNTGSAAEIEILVDGTEKLRVVDVFEFDESGQINSVISYKGL